MTVDLWMLLASVGLQWALIMAAATPALLANGIPWGVGNRETPGKEKRPWEVRLGKASDNLAENLVLFAVLVLVVHVVGAANETSALGAQVFLGARVAHAAVYVAGIAWVRTGVWAVSVAGMFMVASVLF